MIANFELILPHISHEQAETLLIRADLHQRFASIDFKVLEVKGLRVVLRITQGKSHAEVYFDNKRLSEIGKELFEGIGDWQVVTRPIPYQPKPTDVVTADWINEKITERGVTLKVLSVALGIDANTLSAYRRGLKPLSGPVKAAFFYYFTR